MGAGAELPTAGLMLAKGKGVGETTPGVFPVGVCRPLSDRACRWEPGAASTPKNTQGRPVQTMEGGDASSSCQRELGCGEGLADSRVLAAGLVVFCLSSRVPMEPRMPKLLARGPGCALCLGLGRPHALLRPESLGDLYWCSEGRPRPGSYDGQWCRSQNWPMGMKVAGKIFMSLAKMFFVEISFCLAC